MKNHKLVFAVLAFASLSWAEDRATVTGQISDAAGKPMDHATVMIYSAGAKKGYSVFCPTCYTDCGKRTVTGEDGKFSIAGVSPDLVFTLIVLREGYASTYINDVNPDNGPASGVLKPRAEIADATQSVRGHVVDAQGKPVRDAVIEQHGITIRDAAGRMSTRFGGGDGWIDQIGVTNEQGDFEIAFGKPAVQMILNVQARGKAPKLFVEPTGAERHTMAVTDGSTITGRLVYEGKPVANAEIGIMTHMQNAGTSYPEMRIGTRDDGTFAITNIPAGRIWMVYPKMTSLTDRGAGLVHPLPAETKDDGQMVDIGDIQLVKAYTLRGKVVLSDGKPLPPNMHVTLTSDRGMDVQIATIGEDATFEFKGLAPGVYGLAPGVRGYRLVNTQGLEVLLRGDMNDLAVRMEPGPMRPY